MCSHVLFIKRFPLSSHCCMFESHNEAEPYFCCSQPFHKQISATLHSARRKELMHFRSPLISQRCQGTHICSILASLSWPFQHPLSREPHFFISKYWVCQMHKTGGLADINQQVMYIHSSKFLMQCSLLSFYKWLCLKNQFEKHQTRSWPSLCTLVCYVSKQNVLFVRQKTLIVTLTVIMFL